MQNLNLLLHTAILAALGVSFLILSGCSSNENYNTRGYVISQSQIENDIEPSVSNEPLNKDPE